MALTVSISASQSIAYNNLITLTDTSTGTDGTITNRRVYFRTASNQYLYEPQASSASPTYIDWSYADASQQFDILTESSALEITVQWLAGSTVVYTLTDTFCFDLQDYVFALGILAAQTSSPGVLQDVPYYQSFLQLVVNIFNAESAITYGDDIYSAQGALNRNQVFINNESYYF
jgi:hypothetical protein